MMGIKQIYRQKAGGKEFFISGEAVKEARNIWDEIQKQPSAFTTRGKRSAQPMHMKKDKGED